MSTIELPEGIDPKSIVFVNEDQLNILVSQNQELKADVIALVGVFGIFTGLLTGGGFGQIIKVLPKLLADKEKMASISLIVPIIEKYTKPVETLTDGKEQQ